MFHVCCSSLWVHAAISCLSSENTSLNIATIQFYFIYLHSAFYNKIVSRCFTESEPQSLNPQVRKHSGKEKLNVNRKKPWAGPGLQGGTSLLRVSRVKDRNERETGQRESREGERENKCNHTRSNIKNTYINDAAMGIWHGSCNILDTCWQQTTGPPEKSTQHQVTMRR